MGSPAQRRLRHVAIPGVVAVAAGAVAAFSSHLLLWLATGVLLGALSLLLGTALDAVLPGSRPGSLPRFANVALLCLAASLPWLGLELFLALDGGGETRLEHARAEAPPPELPRIGKWIEANAVGELARLLSTGPGELVAEASRREDSLLEPGALEAMRARAGVKTLPAAWEKRAAEVPGALDAFYWHGVLHVRDENGFRRTTPFPPRRPGVLRIVVVGDSLTYGYGVDERWTYVSLLDRHLGTRHPVEFLNLGIRGAQSQDVLRTVRRYVPLLEPDLLLYGVCQNDFLPAGKRQYDDYDAYALPLPGFVKGHFLERTRAARFVADRYDATLRRLDLRRDFFDDILDGFTEYQARFSSDVDEIAAFAAAQGLPPVIAIVLDPFPQHGGRGHEITRIAEEQLAESGFDVIGTEAFYREYGGHAMPVSLWEAHPNEEAHAVFATLIQRHLEGRGHLEDARPAADASDRQAARQPSG